MSVSRLYLQIIGILLIGYAIFDKGFAYIGRAPVFVGEIGLAAGMLCLLTGGISSRVVKSPMVWALTVFGFWSIARTIPFIDIYGMATLRDSVLWLYSLYAIFIAGALLKARALSDAPRWYGAWLPWFLVVAPVTFFVYEKYGSALPRFPGTEVPILWMKAGDMSVHLAGIATFMGLGLHRYFWKRQSNLMEYAVWMLLGFDVIAAGSRNRGGFLSVIVACFVMMLFKPMNRMNRFIVPGLLILGIGLAFDVRIPVGGYRDVSIQQIVDNVQSVLGESDEDYLQTTESWRLEWWRRITNDTIFGDYFWDGKGYGVSLAKVQGYDDGTGNRSPHNAHLTILARSGVTGAVLWLLFLSVVSLTLIQGIFKARATGHDVLAKLNTWVLTYWLAYLVNASFDVYLEGPQGGIWFWSVTGFAIALSLEQRRIGLRAQYRPVARHQAAARG